MSRLSVAVCRLRPDAVLPVYATEHAAGMDLCAALDAPTTLQPGERQRLPTGIALAIPVGYEGQVRPRSGLAFRHGVTMVNTPGTIDADYRGEICVLMINLGQEPVEISPGDRIAQLVIAPVMQVSLLPVAQLDETARGAGGFGHTGVGTIVKEDA